MTESDIQRGLELEAKASPAPWNWGLDIYKYAGWCVSGGTNPDDYKSLLSANGNFEDIAEPNCRLTSFLRNHAKELLLAAERGKLCQVALHAWRNYVEMYECGLDHLETIESKTRKRVAYAASEGLSNFDTQHPPRH